VRVLNYPVIGYDKFSLSLRWKISWNSLSGYVDGEKGKNAAHYCWISFW